MCYCSINRHTMLLFFIFVFSIYVFPFCESVEVWVKNGVIRGFEDETKSGRKFYSFLGVPYAAPPVNQLRFEDPHPAHDWEGIRNTTTAPEQCYQVRLYELMTEEPPMYVGNEDCLIVNVFTPKIGISSNSLPVMAWIHGGGFLAGDGNHYKPHVLMEEDIVLVVIQYRLGVFGFLSTGDSVLPGNLGLKDQTMALRWIQENIPKFGGDKKRVTLFGASAGGASVSLHMLSPMSKGLFNGVISQSGTALCNWVRVRTHRKLAAEIGKAFDCPIEEENYKECLKQKDALKLTQEMYKYFQFGMAPLQTSPRVDGEFLPNEPELLLMNGDYNQVNVMSGATTDDGAFVTMMLYREGSESLKNISDPSLNYRPISLFFESENDPEKLAEKVYDFYLHGKEVGDSSEEELTKMFGDSYFIVPHEITSELLLKNQNIQVYLYEFAYRGQYSFGDGFNITGGKADRWVAHYDDVSYLFDGGMFKVKTAKNDLLMQKKMVKLWTNFARTGNPTPSKTELGFEWEAATKDNFDHLHINLNPKMMSDNRHDVRRMWLSLDTLQNKLLRSQENNSGNNIFLNFQLKFIYFVIFYQIIKKINFN